MQSFMLLKLRVKLESILVSEEEIERGFKETPAAVIEAFAQAKANIEEFHAQRDRKSVV